MDKVSPYVSPDFWDQFFEHFEVSPGGWEKKRFASGQRCGRESGRVAISWRPGCDRAADRSGQRCDSDVRGVDETDDANDADGGGGGSSTEAMGADAKIGVGQGGERDGPGQDAADSTFLPMRRDPHRWRSAKAVAVGDCSKIGTWNVEGISLDNPVKLEQLKKHMENEGLDLLCIQETHVRGAPYFLSDGYLVICSGSDADREYAGVGFIVSPSLRPAVRGFKQLSERLCSIRLRVSGGAIVFISAYAPQNGRSYEQRQDFFNALGEFYVQEKSHGPSYILGDLNARLHVVRDGEGDVIGPAVFGNPRAQTDATSNRELLVEMCKRHSLTIANTLFEAPAEQLVTYYDLSAHAKDDITPRKFAQLDLVLVPLPWASSIAYVRSNRDKALQSHHFLVTAGLSISISKTQPKERNKSKNLKALQDTGVQATFAGTFVRVCTEALGKLQAGDVTPEGAASAIKEGFVAAADEALPERTAQAHRPWISDTTLGFIDERDEARRASDWRWEMKVNKNVKASAKADRRAWLDALVEDGSWHAVKAAKKDHKHQHGRLKNRAGELVSSDERTEAFAEYYEQVQWKQPAAEELPRRPALGPELPVNMGTITVEEVRRALRKLKSGKAAGRDGFTSDFWKALLANDEAVTLAATVCKACWAHKRLPESWHEALVVPIFKKGDVADPSNYRPISLLAVGYKILAAILLDRLKRAGAEKRIRRSQYGFVSGKGTTGALFVARRVIEAALSLADGKVMLLLLDWSKAFDRVSPAALYYALDRFGIPAEFVQMIMGVYEERTFCVRDGGHTSKAHPQHSGISQGCPLSPFLFVILMTVLLQDVEDDLAAAHGRAPDVDFLPVRDLLYADDTLGADVSPEALQAFLDAVADHGARYGLSLNWDKTVLMPIRHDGSVSAPDGTRVRCVDHAVYLGGLLSQDGNPASELSRRIGEAGRTLEALSRVWKHANITRERKLEVYRACVLPKLLYGLETIWLRSAEQRRLNAFQARSLRKVLGIPHSYVSRVSNAQVLQQANDRPLFHELLRRQMNLYGKIVRMSNDDLQRQVALKAGSAEPAVWQGNLRRGRPRQVWTTCVYGHVQAAYGEEMHRGALAEVAPKEWENKIAEYIAKLALGVDEGH